MIYQYLYDLMRRAQIRDPKRKWWIGFDLDGTLAMDNRGSWPDIGAVIPDMALILQHCVKLEWPVRIVTARLDHNGHTMATLAEQREMIDDWVHKQCAVPRGAVDVVSGKDPSMVVLFDDRVIPVLTNTGKIGFPFSDSPQGPDPEPRQAATVPEILAEGSATFASRNAAYGDSYKHAGQIWASLFPEGVTIKTPEEWNRFLAFFHLTNKVARYARNLESGGQKDSAHDAMVYAAILESLT